MDDGNKHRFTINALLGKYIYDNQEFNFTPVQSSGTHKPFIFFGFSSINNNEIVANSLWSGRLYEAWIYNGYEADNTTPKIINHFIPVKRKSDNKICLYDIVTETFFTNQGTGTFIAGPAKEE